MPDYPTPPPGTECPEHEGHPATIYCTACHRPLCNQCLDISSTEPRCTRCSVTEILQEVRQEWAAKDEKRALSPRENQALATRIRFRRQALLGIISLLLCILAADTFSDTTLTGRTVYAVNLPVGKRPGLNGCLREMWRTRNAVEQYVAEHGAVPASLRDALDGSTPVCPACGRPFVYHRKDSLHYILLCPEPERHEVAGIRVISGSAPTIVESSQSE